MSASKKLVVDANILLRGVFGTRVRGQLASYQETVFFYTPDLCVVEAMKYVQAIAERRRLDPEDSVANLNQILLECFLIVDQRFYEEFEQRARARISSRDADDWPVIATAMLIDAPVWTEDRDFFGSGIATWTSNNVEIYLRDT
jgi:predicted nucleic acid-binding protein